MSPVTVILFALVCFVSSMVQSTTGSSFGIPMMTFNPFFLPSYNLCVTLSIMLSTTNNFTLALRMWKHASPKAYLPAFFGNIIVSWFTLKYALSQPDSKLIKMLGVFLILMSIYLMFAFNKIKLKATWYSGVLAGAVSGLMGTLFGTAGPPAILYFMAVSDEKEQYMGNMQVYFLLSGIVAIIMRVVSGSITTETIPYYLIGVAMIIIGTRIGLKLFRRMNTRRLSQLIYIVMALGGVTMLVK